MNKCALHGCPSVTSSAFKFCPRHRSIRSEETSSVGPNQIDWTAMLANLRNERGRMRFQLAVLDELIEGVERMVGQ